MKTNKWMRTSEAGKYWWKGKRVASPYACEIWYYDKKKLVISEPGKSYGDHPLVVFKVANIEEAEFIAKRIQKVVII